jgi:hypothetical protein
VIPRFEELWKVSAEEALASERFTQSLPFDVPSYFDVFSGHATVLLGEDGSVKVSESGRAALRSADGIPTYYADGQLFSRHRAWQLLEVIAGGDERGITIEKVLGKARGPRRPVLLRHVMWLLKYGLVEVAALGSARQATHAGLLFETPRPSDTY